MRNKKLELELMEEIDEIRKKYTFDALGFLENYMPACWKSGIYEWQKDLFHDISLAQGRLSYAIVGSPAVGKTTMVARLFIWKLLTLTNCNLTFMAMNEMQTRGVGLKTLENLIKRNNLDRFFVTSESKAIRTITGNEVTIARINEARQTAIRGKHCEGHAFSAMIFVVDEASEAPDFVFENILPNLSQQRDPIYDDDLPENVKEYISDNSVKSANCIEIIMTNAASGSNTQGYFYRVTADPIGMGYELIAIPDQLVRSESNMDSEYWDLAESRFSGFTAQYRDCEFAKVMNSLVDTETLIAVAHRPKQNRAFINTKVIMGVDVASGTSVCFTAFCIRREHEVLYWEAKDLDLRMIGEEIQKLSAEFNVDEVYYDATGFGSALGAFVSGLNIFRFIGNAKSLLGFANMRSQVLHAMGHWFQHEHTTCPLTRNEISYISALRWYIGRNSDIYFQAKKHNRRSGQQQATDKVDALSYTFVNYNNPYAKSKSYLKNKDFTIRTVHNTGSRINGRSIF